MKQQIPTQENEHVSVDVEKKEGCKVILTVRTKPTATRAAMNAAAKTVSKEVNIPGFRKGRAPEALVMQQFKGAVEKEFRDILIRNALNEAIQLTSIRPFSQQASLKLLKCDKIDDASYLIGIEFDAFPELPTVDPTTLELKEIPEEAVKDSEIETKIEELRYHHAEWEEVTDRAAQEGDFVVLDIDLVDDQPINVHKDSRFQLKEGRMPHWAIKIVKGLKIGEAAEGFSEPEKEENQDNFTPRKCRLTLNRLQTAKLPAVDDALAKKAGVGTAPLLREAIHKSIERDIRLKAQQERRMAMKKQLISNYPFELPTERIAKLHDECHQMANQEGSKFATDQEREDYAHRLLEEAENTVRLSYMLPKIIRDNHLLLPTAEEVQRRSTEYLMSRYMAGHTNIGEEEVAHFAKVAESELITERALDFLIEKAKRA